MHHVIFCTCPSAEVAEQLARGLIEESLAACINILPGVRSVYRWQGEIEIAQEHLLMIKSPCAAYPAIEAAIKARHPYEIPEIIAIDIDRGAADYLKWIDSCLCTQ